LHCELKQNRTVAWSHGGHWTENDFGRSSAGLHIGAALLETSATAKSQQGSKTRKPKNGREETQGEDFFHEFNSIQEKPSNESEFEADCEHLREDFPAIALKRTM
jgi:hypothetical protein